MFGSREHQGAGTLRVVNASPRAASSPPRNEDDRRSISSVVARAAPREHGSDCGESCRPAGRSGRHRRGKQQRLTPGRQLGDHAAVGQKPMSSMRSASSNTNVCTALKIDVALVHQVTSRPESQSRCRPRASVPRSGDFGSHRQTPPSAAGRMGSVSGNFRRSAGQLPRRREDQHTNAATAAAWRVSGVGQPVQMGRARPPSFPCPSGRSKHVQPSREEWLALDRGGSV